MAAGENNDSWPIRFGVTVADDGVEAGVAVSGSAKSGRDVSSAPASAAAAKIRDGGDLGQIAFFQALLRSQLGAIAAEEQQKVSDEPRLIMTPAEAMRAREAARMRRR